MVESKLQDLLDSPEFEAVLDKKLESLGSSPMGMMLSMMSLNAAKIKPFIKAVNFTHLMPTRYQCDLELQGAVSLESLKEGKRADARKNVKKLFEARYNNQDGAKSDKAFTGTQFFFDKLRF